MKRWNLMLLSLWLVLTGVFFFLKMEISYSSTIFAILEIAAGILLLLAGKKTKPFLHLGVILLALFLVMQGLFYILKFGFSGDTMVLGVLAAAAAILIPMGMKGRRLGHHLGLLFLVIWLYLTALSLLINLRFSGMPFTMAVVTILVGVLLFLEPRKS